MKISILSLLFAIAMLSCSKYKESVHFVREDSDYYFHIFDSTLQAYGSQGCLVSVYDTQSFYQIDDSTMIIRAVNKRERNEKDYLVMSDLSPMDNDTFYYFTDSVRISISGNYLSFIRGKVTRQKN